MLHYKPVDGYFGDPIPFFWQGVYHVFYLKAPLEPKRYGADFTPYEHLSTRDFIHWKEHSQVIAPSVDGPDALSCWTGSVFHKDGLFYLFYTGHNTRDQQRPQTICLATSADLETWEKSDRNPIMAPNPDLFQRSDWRDPFILWNEQEQCYMMSITTIRTGDCYAKGGSLAVARSRDLHEWKVGEVFYNPGNHNYPECSDIFQLGDYWYLVTSIYDKTCYLVGDSPLGPWRRARTDSFDGVLNYAMKTLCDGENRFALGWIRTRGGRTDQGPWEWGGHMSFPRQLVPHDDGTLFVKLPDQFEQLRGLKLFELEPGQALEAPYGLWRISAEGIMQEAPDLFGQINIPCVVHGDYECEVEFELSPGAQAGGILFRTGDAREPGYEVAVDLKHQQLILRRHTSRFGCIACTDVCLQAGEKLHLRILVEDSIVEIFLNDKYALAGRCYVQPEQEKLAFFVNDGAGALRAVRLHALTTVQTAVQSDPGMVRSVAVH